MDRADPLVLLSAPSGAGKTTTVEFIISMEPTWERVITSTTRQPRDKEVDGKDYYFRTEEQFEQMIKKNQLAEFDGYVGARYGTETQVLNRIWESKKVPICAITLPGVVQIKEKYPHALTMFIQPKDVAELQARILRRGKMNLKELRRRLKRAKGEMVSAPMICDTIFINGDGMQEGLVKRMSWLIQGYLTHPIFNHFMKQ